MTARPLIAGSPPTPQARGDRGRWCENALLRRAMKQARAARDEETAAALVDALAGADLIVPTRPIYLLPPAAAEIARTAGALTFP